MNKTRADAAMTFADLLRAALRRHTARHGLASTLHLLADLASDATVTALRPSRRRPASSRRSMEASS